MRESKSAIMGDVSDPASVIRSKVVGNNTVEYERADGTQAIRLHHTDVVTFEPNGDVVLNSGGWKTVTTKERINRYLRARLHQSLSVYSERGRWWILDERRDGDVRIPFVDGVVLPGGSLEIDKTVEAEYEQLSKQQQILGKDIERFVKLVDTTDPLPVKEAGDCWICLMFDGNLKPGGRVVTDVDHLVAHIEEAYLFGALIERAMVWAGYRYIYIAAEKGPEYMHDRDSIKRALRRYLKRQLGIG
jgi:hypothetical protein